jgi:hypothetical protein
VPVIKENLKPCGDTVLRDGVVFAWEVPHKERWQVRVVREGFGELHEFLIVPLVHKALELPQRRARIVEEGKDTGFQKGFHVE